MPPPTTALDVGGGGGGGCSMARCDISTVDKVEVDDIELRPMLAPLPPFKTLDELGVCGRCM